MQLLAVGGCDERAVNDEVKEIDPRGLTWKYLVVEGAEVKCEERRVVVQLGPGASVLLASVGDDASGGNGARLGPELVRAFAQDARRIDPNAALSGERQATLGQGSLPGYCGRVDLRAEGNPLVSHICAAWITRGDASHFVVVAVTDTEQNFAQVGMSVDALVGGLIDGLSVE